MRAIRNFIIYFLVTVVILGFFYGLGQLLKFLLEQPWGFLALGVLLASLFGLMGAISNKD